MTKYWFSALSCSQRRRRRPGSRSNREKLGTAVATIVEHLSDGLPPKGARKGPRLHHKTEYLSNLQGADALMLLLSAANKLSKSASRSDIYFTQRVYQFTTPLVAMFAIPVALVESLFAIMFIVAAMLYVGCAFHDQQARHCPLRIDREDVDIEELLSDIPSRAR